MSLATRLSLVALVLVIGVGTAMLFRKQPPESTDAVGAAPETLLLRKSPAASPPQAAVVRASQHAASQAPRDMGANQGALGETPAGHRALPPPDLENTFAQTMMPLRTKDHGELERFPRTQSSENATDEEDGPRPPRTRIVVDGDSLRSLAKRYLGSSDRYMEIYEANRDVLASPDLLRIGMTLKIPEAAPAAAQRRENLSSETMVEIKN